MFKSHHFAMEIAQKIPPPPKKNKINKNVIFLPDISLNHFVNKKRVTVSKTQPPIYKPASGLGVAFQNVIVSQNKWHH